MKVRIRRVCSSLVLVLLILLSEFIGIHGIKWLSGIACANGPDDFILDFTELLEYGVQNQSRANDVFFSESNLKPDDEFEGLLNVPKSSVMKQVVGPSCGRALAKMNSIAAIEVPESCQDLVGLVKRQQKICKRNIEVMDSVRYGALIAIDECQHQFRNRRWNCSTVDPVKLFGNVLKLGTRETAFVHAISAAGVAHAVTRACSKGDIQQCGCDRTVSGRSSDGFEWSGCSDNIEYGIQFSRRFVDARERKRKKKSLDRYLMNIHNNGAGRMAIANNMQIVCKCHGVSGSCELKTCWRSMPTFREIGAILKESFDGATEVKLVEKKSRSGMLVPVNEQFKPPTLADIVYLVASPDFCENDPRTGSLGTKGRACNKTSKAIDGCDLMCCGRGYETRTITLVERCQCKFYWCCYVNCEKCTRTIDEHVCK